MRLILGIDTTSNHSQDLPTNVPLSPRSLSPGRRPRTFGHHYETVSDAQSRISNPNRISINNNNELQPPIVQLLTQPAYTVINYPISSNELIQRVSNAVSGPALSSTAQVIYNSSYSGIQVSFSLVYVHVFIHFFIIIYIYVYNYFSLMVPRV